MRWDGTAWGAEREVKRFLMIPKKVNGEWRWLESAIIHQTYLGSWDGWYSDWFVNE
jgi:hypothetical protein